MSLRIAVVGASSQIASDLIRSFSASGRADLLLYVRDVDRMQRRLDAAALSGVGSVHPYSQYGEHEHGAVLNFVGVGDPQRAAELGASILELTHRFDDLVLSRLADEPGRRYLFLSSGAAYGQSFQQPASAATMAAVPINALAPQDHYGAAKLYAEVRHRARPVLPIVDLRVFNYFSRTQDMNARFLVTDAVRALRERKVLRTSPQSMVRDYLHPEDFHQLVAHLLDAPPTNAAVDAYSREPIDKASLLAALGDRFGLRFEVEQTAGGVAVNATGAKPHYYSLNRKAAEFGYRPALSSLDGVLREVQALLDQ